MACESVQRFPVVGFEHELDVEFGCRIIEPRQGADEPGRNALFPVERRDDRIDRKIRIAGTRQPAARLDGAAQDRRRNPQGDHAEEQRAEAGAEQAEGLQRKQQAIEDERGESDEEEGDLAIAEIGRQIRRCLAEIGGGLDGNHSCLCAEDGLSQALRRGDRKRSRLSMGQKPDERRAAGGGDEACLRTGQRGEARQDAVRVTRCPRKARLSEIRQPELGREGPVELGFSDQALLQQRLVRGDTGK